MIGMARGHGVDDPDVDGSRIVGPIGIERLAGKGRLGRLLLIVGQRSALHLFLLGLSQVERFLVNTGSVFNVESEEDRAGWEARKGWDGDPRMVSLNRITSAPV